MALSAKIEALKNFLLNEPVINAGPCTIINQYKHNSKMEGSIQLCNIFFYCSATGIKFIHFTEFLHCRCSFKSIM